MSKISTKHLLMGGGLLVALGALAYVSRDSSGPAPAPLTVVATPAVAMTAAQPVAAVDERPVQAAPADAALTRYQVVIARNIFAPPAPKPSDVPPIRMGPRRMDPIIYGPDHEAAEAQVTPYSLANWEFAGYYVENGKPTAVLQNLSEERWNFLVAGDTFFNYKVESVSTKDHGEIVLICGRTRQSLKPTQDFSLVPLQGVSGGTPAVPTRPGGGAGPGMGPGMGRMGPGPGMGPGGMNPGMRRGG